MNPEELKTATDHVVGQTPTSTTHSDTDSLGIASICLGAFSILVALLVPIIAPMFAVSSIVVGVIADRRRAAQHKSALLGRIGWITGVVGMVVTIASIVLTAVLVLTMLSDGRR